MSPLKPERRVLLSLLSLSLFLWRKELPAVDGFGITKKSTNTARISSTTTNTITNTVENKIRYHHHLPTNNRCPPLHSYEGDDDGGTMVRTREDGDEEDERTLYAVLGVSKDDSYERIREKYSILAKLTHPDAPNTKKLGPKATAENIAAFSEVTAAWSVLSDPIERKKYDRSLRQKEFEGMLNYAIGEIAIPFFQKTARQASKVAEQTAETFSKTADTTIANIETTSNEMQAKSIKAQHRAEMARDKKRFQSKHRELEQQAAKHLTRAEKLHSKIDALPQTHLEVLSEPKSVIMTSSEALQILDEFAFDLEKLKKNEADDVDVAAASTRDAIFELSVAEDEYEDSTVHKQNNEVDVETAAQQMDQAVKAKLQAQKNLEEAQQMVMEAKKAVDVCRRDQAAASTARTRAKAEMKKKATLLEVSSGRVKAELLKEERKKMKIETNYLNEQIKEHKDNAKSSLEQSKEYQRQADEYKNMRP